MVAAAEAPAKPEPTTITECLRLLDGFTNFMSNLVRVQRVVMSPDGTLELSSMFLLLLNFATDETEHHRHRN